MSKRLFFRTAAETLAFLLLTGCLLPAAAVQAAAEDFASYERRKHLRNGPSPMDVPPERAELSTENVPRPVDDAYVVSLDGQWDMETGRGQGSPEDAGGSGWARAVPADVPGSVYTALFKAGRIDDPYVGKNMEKANQNSRKFWYLRRVFTYEGSGRHVELVFKGLCNVADVYLNGQRIVEKHEGMFGGPVVDVTGVVRQGENTLIVRLYPAKDFHDTVVFNCSYGWHYARLFPLGIWQSVTLRDCPETRLDAPFIAARDAGKGEMDLSVRLRRGTKGDMDGRLTVTVSPRNFEGTSAYFTREVRVRDAEEAQLRYRFEIPDFRLWWPNGYGRQDLYDLCVRFESANGETDTVRAPFGIRTLAYLPFPDGERPDVYNRWIAVNGVPTFMKGMNFCTIDAMMRFGREDYDRILSRARDAGVNFLRAWGGGLVETDEFYDLCDEYGLCVYQEFPCCWDSHKTQPAEILYDTVRTAVRRLRNRASLVVWGGGNEGVAAVGDETLNRMGALTYELDGTRVFWRQDGGAGAGGICHDHIHWGGQTPEHYLTTYADQKNLNLTEYGLDSLMNEESIRRFATEREMAEWPPDPKGAIAYHTATFNGMFGWGPTPWGHDLDTFLHYASLYTGTDSLRETILGTQLAQAQAIYLPAINARINAPACSANVAYKLNDNFPGASWSVVDFYGAPKMAYYLMQDAYRPLMAAVKLNASEILGSAATSRVLPVYLLDDAGGLAGRDWTVTVSAYGEDLALLKSQTFRGSDGRRPVTRVGDFALSAEEAKHVPLILTTDLSVGGVFLNRTYAYLNATNEPSCLFYLPRTTLEWTVSAGSPGTLTVRNTGKVPAVGVQILCRGSDTFVCGDNFLFLGVGEQAVIPVNRPEDVRDVVCFNFCAKPDGPPPAAPSAPKATDVAVRSAVLSWTPPADGQGILMYRVYLSDGRTERVFRLQGRRKTLTLEDLSGLTEYTVRVEAVDDAGRVSPKSEPLSFRTEEDREPLSIRCAEARGDGTIRLQLSDPPDRATAEDPNRYLMTGGASVVSAAVDEDGQAVLLRTEGMERNRSYTLGVVGLRDAATGRRLTPYTERTVDEGLYLEAGFETDARGKTYTSGRFCTELRSLSGAEPVYDAGGAEGQAFRPSGNALTTGPLDYTFREGNSLSFWFKGAPTESGYEVFLAKGPKTAGHFEIYSINGNLMMYAPDLGNDVGLGVNARQLGDGWHCVTIVWEEQRLRTYADGAERSSVPLAGTIAETEVPLTLGALNDGSLPCSCLLDRARLYTRPLSAEEAAEEASLTDPAGAHSGTLRFAESLMTMERGTVADDGLERDGDDAPLVTVCGDAVVRTEDGRIRAEKAGESILRAVSADGRRIAAAMVVVTEPDAGTESPTESPEPPTASPEAPTEFPESPTGVRTEGPTEPDASGTAEGGAKGRGCASLAGAIAPAAAAVAAIAAGSGRRRRRRRGD